MSGPRSTTPHVWLGTASLIALFSATAALAAPTGSADHASRRERDSSPRIVRQDPGRGSHSNQSPAGRYDETRTAPLTGITQVVMVRRSPHLTDGSADSESLDRDHSHLVFFPDSKDLNGISRLRLRGPLSRDVDRHVGDDNPTPWPTDNSGMRFGDARLGSREGREPGDLGHRVHDRHGRTWLHDASGSRFDDATLGSGEEQEAAAPLASLVGDPGTGWHSSDRRWLVGSPIVPTAQLNPLSSSPSRGRRAWVDLSTDSGASKVEAGLTLKLR